MSYQLKDEENNSGRTDNNQNGGEEPITIETEIEIDWRKKGQPPPDSATPDNKAEKK